MKAKKFIITALAAAAALSLVMTGCSKDDADNTATPPETPGPSAENPSNAPTQGITVNDISFQEIDTGMIGPGIADMIDDLALAGGFYYWVDSEGTYTVFIGLGERPTAGYGIKVVSVQDNEGNTNITVEETKPREGEMTAQVITYPYTLVRMSGITDNFNIVDKDGNKFEQIEPNGLNKHMVVCIYEGLSDNTSIETTLDGSPVIFRNDDMASKVDGLAEGTMVRIVYSNSGEGQNILEGITPIEDYSKKITASGIYQGLIDNNSLEVLVDGVYIAFRNKDVESMADGIERDEPVELVYSISDEGQFVLESIKPAE